MQTFFNAETEMDTVAFADMEATIDALATDWSLDRDVGGWVDDNASSARIDGIEANGLPDEEERIIREGTAAIDRLQARGWV